MVGAKFGLEGEDLFFGDLIGRFGEACFGCFIVVVRFGLGDGDIDGWLIGGDPASCAMSDVFMGDAVVSLMYYGSCCIG